MLLCLLDEDSQPVGVVYTFSFFSGTGCTSPLGISASKATQEMLSKHVLLECNPVKHAIHVPSRTHGLSLQDLQTDRQCGLFVTFDPALF
jgi:hypothetical protein